MRRFFDRRNVTTARTGAVWDRAPRRRRGAFMAEAGIALLSLTIAMTLTLKVAGWIGQENRAGDRRQRAVLEAANLMERMSAVPFDQLDSKAVANFSLSAATAQALPSSKLTIDVRKDDPVGGSGSKRVDVTIRWRDNADEWTAPVRLSSWTYATGSKGQ